MLLSLLATIAAGLAALMLLANLAATGAYMNAPPQGADAMGIVMFLVFSALIALLLPFATLCLLGNGRIAAFTLKPAWLGLPISLLIGAAVVAALLMWAELRGARGLISLYGLLCGGLVPLLGCVMLVIAAWRAPLELQQAVWWQWAQWPLLLTALGGAGAIVFGLVNTFRG